MSEEVLEGRDLTDSEIAHMAAISRLSAEDGLGIGLSGAHRTGKTSICQRLSEKNPIPFLRTSAKAAAEEYGFDVNNPGSLADRLGWQEFLLTRFEEQYATQDGLFFADRTPLDMAAYMMADVTAGEIDPEIDKRIDSYVSRCLAMTDRFFAAVVIIQPGIAHVPVDGSPAPNRAYQEKLNALMLGLAPRLDRPHYIIGRNVTDFQERCNAVADLTSKTYARYRLLLQTLPRQ